MIIGSGHFLLLVDKHGRGETDAATFYCAFNRPATGPAAPSDRLVRIRSAAGSVPAVTTGSCPATAVAVQQQQQQSSRAGARAHRQLAHSVAAAAAASARSGTTAGHRPESTGPAASAVSRSGHRSVAAAPAFPSTGPGAPAGPGASAASPSSGPVRFVGQRAVAAEALGAEWQEFRSAKGRSDGGRLV